MAKDISTTDFGDLQIAGGDLATGNSDQQHVNDLLLATPGELKASPRAGIGLIQALNGPLGLLERSALARAIRVQLRQDGAQDISVSYGPSGLLETAARYLDGTAPMRDSVPEPVFSLTDERIEALSNAGASISGKQAGAIRAFLNGLVAAGIWEKTVSLLVPVWGNVPASRMDWKRLEAGELTEFLPGQYDSAGYFLGQLELGLRPQDAGTLELGIHYYAPQLDGLPDPMGTTDDPLTFRVGLASQQPHNRLQAWMGTKKVLIAWNGPWGGAFSLVRDGSGHTRAYANQNIVSSFQETTPNGSAAFRPGGLNLASEPWSIAANPISPMMITRNLSNEQVATLHEAMATLANTLAA